jgi:hypothetical protein
MKTLLILASLAALSTAALADTETRTPIAGDTVGVLPEFVVTARKVAGTESAGVLPEYVVTAPKIAGTESVGVLPEFVVTARKVAAADTAALIPSPERSPAPRATETARPGAIAAAAPIVGTLSRM